MSSPIRRSRLLRRSRKVGARKVRVPAVGTALAVALLAMTPATPVAAARSATAYDFNGDGWADLAVGVPGDPVGDLARAGAVQVINGSRTGLTASGSRTWNQGSPGIQGVPGPMTLSVRRTRPLTSMETDTPTWPSAFRVEAWAQSQS